MGKYSSKKFRYNRHNVMRNLAKRKEFKMYEEDVALQNDLWSDLIKDLKGKFKNLNTSTNIIDKIMDGGILALDVESTGNEPLKGNIKENLKELFNFDGGSGEIGGGAEFGMMVLKDFLKGSILKDNRFDPTTMYGNINRGKYLYNEEDVDKKNKGFSKKINQLFSSVKDDISTSLFDDLFGDKIKSMSEDGTDSYKFTDYWEV